MRHPMPLLVVIVDLILALFYLASSGPLEYVSSVLHVGFVMVVSNDRSRERQVMKSDGCGCRAVGDGIGRWKGRTHRTWTPELHRASRG